MPTKNIKSQSAEIKLLKRLVDSQASTITLLTSQLEQKDSELKKRIQEVTALHQACAKYKSAHQETSRRSSRLEPVSRTNQATQTSSDSYPIVVHRSKKVNQETQTTCDDLSIIEHQAINSTSSRKV